MDPTQPWYSRLSYYGELACWYAMADPESAFSKFFPLDPDTAITPDPTYQTLPMNTYTEGGKNAADVYQFIRFLQLYGVPDPMAAHATNTPFSMVFTKENVKTYVGFNPDSAPLDITFNDGTIIHSVSPRSFGFWPSGYPQPSKASFTSNITSGMTVPVTARFTDTSAGSIISWIWSVNGKEFSTIQNPDYQFDESGTYTIELTVTDVHQQTQKTSLSYKLGKTGELNGSFWYNTIDSGMENTSLFPSFVVDENSRQASYFIQPSGAVSPGTVGTLKYVSLTSGFGNITPLIMEPVTNLTWQSWMNSTFLFGQSSLCLDGSETPHITTVALNENQPQQLMLYWREGKNSWSGIEITDAFPWDPAITFAGDRPLIAYSSGNLKNIRVAYAPGSSNYKTDGWGQFNVEPPLSGAPSDLLPTIRYISAVMSKGTNTPHLVYYNQTSSELRHAWLSDWNTPDTWTTETIASGLSVGWTSAAYAQAGDTLGICYAYTGLKKVVYREKQGTGSWSEPVPLNSPANISGTYCSLAYQAGTQNLIPVASFHDEIASQVTYAWRDSGGWHTAGIDHTGSGPFNAVQLGADGVARVVYHDSLDSSLKTAVLKPVNFSVYSYFSSDTRSGKVPFEVQFYDNTSISGNNTVSIYEGNAIPFFWMWDFNGDGIIDSDEQNPVYSYQIPGSHPVTEWVFYYSCPDEEQNDCDLFYVVEHQRDYIIALENTSFDSWPIKSPELRLLLLGLLLF